MVNVVIKKVDEEEIEDLIRVENESWEPRMRADKQILMRRLKIFPQGFLGAYLDNKLVGVSYGQPIKEVKKTWKGNTEAFDPNGKIFYIVNVGVSKYYQRMGIGTKLMEADKEFVRKNGFEKIILGSRVNTVDFYRKNGFDVIEKIHNFWPEDEESVGVGVLMKYTNHL